MWQDGGVVRVDQQAPEQFRPAEIHTPIDPARVFSVDTESLTANGALATVLLLAGFHDEEMAVETAGKDPAVELCRLITDRFGVPTPAPSALAQRDPAERAARKGRPDGRDGRRATIPPCVAVWFNLEYDLGRIFARRRHLLRSVFAGAASYRIRVSARYEIEVVRLVLGSGSHFEWFVRDRRRRVVARVVGIDMVGYWKTSLAKAAKATGATDKQELDPIAYERPLERFTQQEWEEFRSYGLGDVRTTRELYLATQALLQTVDARAVRAGGIIPPSAPGAAARVMFARAFDLHPGLQHWSRPPAWIEQLACDAYFAGRSFNKAPGLHRDLVSLDLKSAYPHVMALLPDPVTMRAERLAPGPLDLDGRGLRGAYGVVVVDGESLDDVHPPLRTRDPARGGRIRYVAGRFRKLAATIPEVVIGVVAGTLRIDHVHTGFVLRGDPDRSFLRDTIRQAFAIKEDPASAEALVAMAKLLMNSGYGKLVEVHGSEGWIPPVPMPDFVAGPRVAEGIMIVAAEAGAPSGALAAQGVYWGSAIPKIARRARGIYDRAVARAARAPAADRPLLAVAAYVEALDAVGAPARPGPHVSASKYVRAQRTYHAGHYFLPCLAAQVTGLTSARLCLMAQAVDALQGDTDSVHFRVPRGAVSARRDPRTGKETLALDEAQVPGLETHYRVMREAGYPSPRVRPDGSVEDGVPGMEAIGVWAVETWPSDESVLARSKVYSHRYTDPRTGKTKHKQAHHAFSKFTSLEAETIRKNGALPRAEREAKAFSAMQSALHRELVRFVDEKRVVYRTKSAPRRLRAALIQKAEPGVFTSDEKVVLLERDPNTRLGEDGVVRWLPLENDNEQGRERTL